ncbi:hypothetical protein HOY80DRAFT_1047545 [Tuber brumale]|nr:hypothetical protein HOY80DRAFT_1047545 [Tuber brumale]
MAGIINKVLTEYWIQDRILGFTTNSASNNKTLMEALNNALGSLLTEWSPIANYIPCIAHVVQLILAVFMSSIKVKSKDSHIPSGFKADYIDKIVRLNNGFHKTIEKDLDDAAGETDYEKLYRKEFIAYYDLHYTPINTRCPDTPILQSGLNSQSKHLYGSRLRTIINEGLAYIKLESEVAPQEPATRASDSMPDTNPIKIFYEANILE